MDTSPDITVATTEDRVDSMLRKTCACLNDQVACLEEKVIASPTKAVLIAAGVGYVARALPLGSMLSIPVKLAFKLAPPLLLAVGAAKVFEAVRCSGKGPETEGEPLLDLFPRRAGRD